MAEIPEFQRKQYAFAAHIRDPEHVAPPDAIEDRRMGVYRDLFFNNLFKLLGSTFPVLRKLYKDEGWRRIVRAFMVRHRAETPYFLELPAEFIAFLQYEYEPGQDDPAFLVELAHYEWAELALSVSDAVNEMTTIDSDADLLNGVPVKSVLAWSLAYRFPVHRINDSFQPAEPGEQGTFLVIYRDSSDELGFMELNPVTARLLELIDNNPECQSGRELVLNLADEIHYADKDTLLTHGAAAMQSMRQKGILLGVRR